MRLAHLTFGPPSGMYQPTLRRDFTPTMQSASANLLLLRAGTVPGWDGPGAGARHYHQAQHGAHEVPGRWPERPSMQG